MSDVIPFILRTSDVCGEVDKLSISLYNLLSAIKLSLTNFHMIMKVTLRYIVL